MQNPCPWFVPILGNFCVRRIGLYSGMSQSSIVNAPDFLVGLLNPCLFEQVILANLATQTGIIYRPVGKHRLSAKCRMARQQHSRRVIAPAFPDDRSWSVMLKLLRSAVKGGVGACRADAPCQPSNGRAPEKTMKTKSQISLARKRRIPSVPTHRWLMALVTAASSICNSDHVWAVGVRIPNQDPAAIARGNAFVATADNPAAIYYNPAGITLSEGHNVQVGLLGYMNIYVDYESPAGARTKNDPEIIPVPQLHYSYTPENCPLSFGLGVYAPFGLSLSETGSGDDRLVIGAQPSSCSPVAHSPRQRRVLGR